MNFGITAVALVSVATLAIGAYGWRFSRTTSDFFVASRSVRPALNASAIGGEYLSAASFLGVAGLVLAGCSSGGGSVRSSASVTAPPEGRLTKRWTTRSPAPSAARRRTGAPIAASYRQRAPGAPVREDAHQG